MIVVRNLTKSFGEVVAVRDVSFEVEAGEVMGFLGPNGAGKTTTIRVLTGFLPANAGTVQIDGFDVLRQSLEVRERIGYLPEQVPLYLEMRVEEYLKFRGRLKGVSGREVGKNVDRATEQCGLSHMRRRLIGQLSKGYRQRVGLADALIARPKILILDEPTGGLDPHQRNEVLVLIRGLAEEHTILLSSHVLSEVETISSRVMIIQQGELLAKGAPAVLSEQLQESPRVHFELRAPPGRIAAISAGIGEPRYTEMDDGWTRVILQPPAGDDPRVEIGRRVAAADLDLRELRLQKFTLEELFLRITAEAAQQGVVVADTTAEAGAGAAEAEAMEEGS